MLIISYQARSSRINEGCELVFSLLLNAVDESEKKQEIMSTGRKKNRRRSGRIGEKAGNHEHRSEENSEEKRTNRRKSGKS